MRSVNMSNMSSIRNTIFYPPVNVGNLFFFFWETFYKNIKRLTRSKSVEVYDAM